MMQTATSDTHFAASTGVAPAYGASLMASVQRWFAATIAARELQAKAAVRFRLARQSDGTLGELGFAAAEIEAIRREAAKGPLPWC